MARRFTALLAAAVTVSSLSGCPKGTEALVPKTRKGWGIAFIVVGASWIVVGAAAALSPDSEDEPRSAGDRALTALGATAIGLALIGAGWALYPSGDNKKAPQPPPQQPYAFPPPPQPYPPPPPPQPPAPPAN